MGAIGVSVVCVFLLLCPLLGDPPYAFYLVLRVCVALGSGYVASILWGESRVYAPLCFLLIASGGLHFLARMHREEWATFNGVAVLLFIVSAVAMVYRISRIERKNADG